MKRHSEHIVYDLELEDEKHILYKMLAAYNCNGCSSAPLSQYINNEIYQEMPDEDKFADNERDDRTYIDMRRSKSYTDELEKLIVIIEMLCFTSNLKKLLQKN